MVFINGVKYACATCIKGHRSTACHHSDRPLFLIKRKGRPITQCAHCRELRKTQKVHVKCTCNEKREMDQQQLQQQPSNGSSNGGVESQFKIEGPNFIDFNQQSNYEDKHSVEALLNPCKCTSGAKCICCRPVEEDSNMSTNGASPDDLDLSYSSHPQIYDYNRMYPATAPPATMNRPTSSTNMNANHMSILQLANTLSTPGEMFPPITVPMVSSAAPTISATSLQSASPDQNHSQYQRSFQNPIYDKLPTPTNPVPSWNGYVSDDGSVSSEQRESRSSGHAHGHRRIASFPDMLYPLSKTEPQAIDAQPVETYSSYNEEEETNTDESAVLGAQLCHSTSNDLVNMIYSSFQPRDTSTSTCHCGSGCNCQGCVIHSKRVNNGGMVLDVYASDSYQANIDSSGGSAIVGGCCPSSPNTVSNGGNASNNLCGSGNLCNTTPSQIPQSEHTVIVDEDGVLLCGCGCRKPNTECSDCVDSLCEEYLLKQPPM